MPSQKNIQKLDEVKEKVERSTAMFFVDYTGLTHRQLEEARKELSQADSEITIIKNTLMNLALKEKKVDAKEKLHGPHATLFSYKDPIATARILAGFIKKHGLPKIRFGIFSREAGSRSAGEGWDLIDETMIIKLSTLPSREVLIAKLLGTLQSPISNFVYGLNANIQKLALVLKEVQKQKGVN